ncbi:hypothetical protein QVD17_15600 [Tagetes erecta]|uniref:Uncharacterized protein n=1 Tax=Tagetes erecta TaxID=13708 RepID=A0AAD8KPH0_TARER|nr:hypothetical protein QVD17_15600 [Tagetes erecta]
MLHKLNHDTFELLLLVFLRICSILQRFAYLSKEPVSKLQTGNPSYKRQESVITICYWSLAVSFVEICDGGPNIGVEFGNELT